VTSHVTSSRTKGNGLTFRMSEQLLAWPASNWTDGSVSSCRWAGVVIEDTLLVHSSIAKSCPAISEPRGTNEPTLALALCPLMPMSPDW
jgi:hypothetical protein